MSFKYFTIEPVEKVQDLYSINCAIDSVGEPDPVLFEYRFIYDKTNEEQGASNWLAYTIGNAISDSRTEWFAVQFRNTSGTLSKSAYDYLKFTSSEKIRVSGNVMTLLDYRDEVQLYSHCLRNLFFGCDTLIDASELRLPATTLATQCYMNMFGNCTSLTKAPELIATTLATQCYYGMFTGCSNLNQLVYSSNVVPSPSTRSGNSAYWLSNVSPTGTFYYTDQNLNISSFVRTDSGIPEGWSIEYKKEPEHSFSIGGKKVGSSLYINGQSVRFLFINGGLVWEAHEPQPTWAGLKFKSSQDGSTIKMVKVGSRAPDASLEYSIDKGLKIRKIGTDEIYDEAIDPKDKNRTYIETDIPIDEDI